MARVARGVRKVNELLIQNGRSLILSEEDADQLLWENIPDGSIKTNTTTGLISIKLKGESDWTPANIKNDGTISIAKDSIIVEETFTIKTTSDGDGNFSYIDTDKKVVHMPILEDGSFTFELQKGSYPMLRNQITVFIDDVLRRTPSSGGIIEITDRRFALNEALEVGQEITVRYVNVMRLGNPYPRFFLNINEPASAETGDFWLDYDAPINENDPSKQPYEADTTFPWRRISGKPNTINGYGITDPISYQGHQHLAKDIIDLKAQLPTSLKANGGNADTVGYFKPNNNQANSLAILDATGKIPAQNIGEHLHKVSDITDINMLKVNGGNADTLNYLKVNNNNPNTIPVLDMNGKLNKSTIPSHKHTTSDIEGLNLTNATFTKGMIMMWYGASSTVPNGWAVCNGSNGTPDLRDRFIVGAGSKYGYSNTVSGKTISYTNLDANSTNKIASHYALFYIMKL